MQPGCQPYSSSICRIRRRGSCSALTRFCSARPRSSLRMPSLYTWGLQERAGCSSALAKSSRSTTCSCGDIQRTRWPSPSFSMLVLQPPRGAGRCRAGAWGSQSLPAVRPARVGSAALSCRVEKASQPASGSFLASSAGEDAVPAQRGKSVLAAYYLRTQLWA